MEDEDLKKWDHRFLDLALLIASWSKDTSTKVGCVVVGPNREIRSTGYNGLPRGVDDDDPARFERPEKYLYTEHCERNAIYNAARMGLSLEGCTMYMPWFPCADCCRAIIQSGITTLVASEPEWSDPKWGKSHNAAVSMLTEARVAIRWREAQPVRV